MQTIFHRPMCPIELQEPLWRTAFLREVCPPIGHLNTGLVSAGAFALHSKDLSDLAPVAT